MGARRDLSIPSQPRRSARLQKPAAPTAPTPKPAQEDHAKVTKSKPKVKQPQQKYDCTTCGRTLAASSFPKHFPTDTCNSHIINTCRACLKQWIAIQIDSTTYDDTTCPECPETMQNGDIKLHATKDVYNKFDELERRGIADKTPGWRWYLAPRCRAGQVHKAPTQAHPSIEGLGPLRRTGRRIKKSEMIVPAANICTCDECGAKACVDCDRPWHEGETCEEFQGRTREKARAEEEEASLKTIQEESKPCPSCKKNIQRNGGCDHMICTQCREAFCYLCLTTYTVIRQTGHAPDCVYSQPGRFDPHAAGVAAQAVAGGLVVGGLALGVRGLALGVRGLWAGAQAMMRN